MRPVLKRCKIGKEHVKAHNQWERQNLDKGQANHTRTTEEINSFVLLPLHLIYDILARVPICTIFNCKRVCNTFKNILSDPYFAKVQLEKASIDDYSLLIQNIKNPSNILLAPVLDLDKPALYSTTTTDHCDGEYVSWQTLSVPASIPKTRSWDVAVNVLGSCNGLLCVRYLVHYIIVYCVCNPILGEFTILPQSTPLSLEFGAFGFCHKTNQYKVLRFFIPYMPFVIHQLGYSEILTLGTDEWRRISDAPIYPVTTVSFDSSFKGNLHWIIDQPPSGKKSICSFNLDTEKYLYMSLPSCLKEIKAWLRIGTLEGLFCVSCVVSPGQFEAYVMEDYEVKESWIKKVSIDLTYRFNFQVNSGVIGFLNNGAVVLKFCDTQLAYLNTRNGATSVVIVEDGNNYAIAHVPSLLSLKDIVRRESVEQVERKMLHIFFSGLDK